MIKLNSFLNMDCMEGMKEFPDKYFELAIVEKQKDWLYKNQSASLTISEKYLAFV